ncbi:extracellular elastinolytic metallo proteinase [Marasmius fiardii PR-910]|nr:extracellular elastinolytic metallo proteinase [Marasmius fiardii PR-910]
MRCLLIASLVAGLASVSAHKRHGYEGVKLRKSLGFGPTLPHAVYESVPKDTSSFAPPNVNANPFDVARLFIESKLGSSWTSGSSYRIRSDSYTDPSTGVTHVYARQILHGLEVADANMNINVRDGQVISYGSSFHVGSTELLEDEELRHPHREFCEELTMQLDNSYAEFRQQQLDNDQVVMGSSHAVAFKEHAGALTHLHYSNCLNQYVPYDLASIKPPTDISDPRSALLQFMIAATPKDEVVNDILGNYERYIDKMTFSDLSHLVPVDEPSSLFIQDVPETVNPVKAHLAYIQVPSKDGQSVDLNLVWKFEVEMEDNWYEVAVAAKAPHRIISVVDWASDAPLPPPKERAPATYNVFRWGLNDPDEGNRTLEKENYDSLASPLGWHSLPFKHDPSFKGVKLNKEFLRNTTTTWGNNVFAHENWEGQSSYISNYRPEANEGMAFDFKYNPKKTEREDALDEAKAYINASVTQLFYTSNMVHDLYYRYGFTEVAGNFQQYNFGRGGREGDAVIANAQDGSGFNNANFMTPPDGNNGRMRMYLWNTALPYRDGDLEAGIVIHELSHGLSTRLTGGPLNSGCLGWGESGGMGEGWGDFLATTIRSTAEYHDYPMGAWAANTEKGIRNYPYSLNDTINPSTYKTLDKPGYWGVHAIGEVWAELLWIVQQRLITKHGFSKELFPPKPSEDGEVPEGDFYRPRDGKKPLVPKHGNTLSVQLVINGMKLQPCQPSFFDARDAIILADEQLTGGENFCLLWKAFSERGLGVDAKVQGRTPWGGGIRTDGYAVPKTCDSDY